MPSILKHNSYGEVTDLLVDEDFDTVIERLVPTSAPSSSLQAREAMIFHDSESGMRIFTAPQHISLVTEL